MGACRLLLLEAGHDDQLVGVVWVAFAEWRRVKRDDFRPKGDLWFMHSSLADAAECLVRVARVEYWISVACAVISEHVIPLDVYTRLSSQLLCLKFPVQGSMRTRVCGFCGGWRGGLWPANGGEVEDPRTASWRALVGKTSIGMGRGGGAERSVGVSSALIGQMLCVVIRGRRTLRRNERMDMKCLLEVDVESVEHATL